MMEPLNVGSSRPASKTKLYIARQFVTDDEGWPVDEDGVRCTVEKTNEAGEVMRLLRDGDGLTEMTYAGTKEYCIPELKNLLVETLNAQTVAFEELEKESENYREYILATQRVEKQMNEQAVTDWSIPALVYHTDPELQDFAIDRKWSPGFKCGAKWSTKENDSVAVSSDRSGNYLIVHSAEQLPKTGKHYIELEFSGSDAFVGIITGPKWVVARWRADIHSEPLFDGSLAVAGTYGFHATGVQLVTEDDGDYYKASSDYRSPRYIDGRGYATVPLGTESPGFTKHDIVGLLIDMDEDLLQLYRNGEPLAGASLYFKADECWLAASVAIPYEEQASITIVPRAEMTCVSKDRLQRRQAALSGFDATTDTERQDAATDLQWDQDHVCFNAHDGKECRVEWQESIAARDVAQGQLDTAKAELQTAESAGQKKQVKSAKKAVKQAESSLAKLPAKVDGSVAITTSKDLLTVRSIQEIPSTGTCYVEIEFESVSDETFVGLMMSDPASELSTSLESQGFTAKENETYSFTNADTVGLMITRKPNVQELQLFVNGEKKHSKRSFDGQGKTCWLTAAGHVSIALVPAAQMTCVDDARLRKRRAAMDKAYAQQLKEEMKSEMKTAKKGGSGTKFGHQHYIGEQASIWCEHSSLNRCVEQVVVTGEPSWRPADKEAQRLKDLAEEKRKAAHQRLATRLAALDPESKKMAEQCRFAFEWAEKSIGRYSEADLSTTVSTTFDKAIKLMGKSKWTNAEEAFREVLALLTPGFTEYEYVPTYDAIGMDEKELKEEFWAERRADSYWLPALKRDLPQGETDEDNPVAAYGTAGLWVRAVEKANGEPDGRLAKIIDTDKYAETVTLAFCDDQDTATVSAESVKVITTQSELDRRAQKAAEEAAIAAAGKRASAGNHAAWKAEADARAKYLRMKLKKLKSQAQSRGLVVENDADKEDLIKMLVASDVELAYSAATISKGSTGPATAKKQETAGAGSASEKGDAGSLSDRTRHVFEIRSSVELEGDVQEWAKFSEIDAILTAMQGFVWPSLEVINVGSGKPPALLDKEGQAAAAAREADSRKGKTTVYSNPMDDGVKTPAEVSDVETKAMDKGGELLDSFSLL